MEGDHSVETGLLLACIGMGVEQSTSRRACDYFAYDIPEANQDGAFYDRNIAQSDDEARPGGALARRRQVPRERKRFAEETPSP